MTQIIYENVAPLRNVAALLSLIHQVQNRHHGLPGMAVFYGPSGWGKTTAAIYAINKFNACHIVIQPLWRTKNVLEQIALELGLRPAKTSPAIFDQVCEALARSQRPLLLDEADYLCRDQMIEVVRGLHEASGAAVILIGEELLPQKLQRWERVHGRVLAWTAAQEAELADVGHLAAIYCKGVEVLPDLQRRLLVESKRSIRRVSVNLERVLICGNVEGHRKIGLKEWGNREFFNGEAPKPRREEYATRTRMAAESRAAIRGAV